MKFITRFLCVPVAGLLALTSCAKDEDESYVQFENQALEAWMTQHRSDLVQNYQSDGGYYIDVIEAGDQSLDPIGKEPIWVSFDFTGRGRQYHPHAQRRFGQTGRDFLQIHPLRALLPLLRHRKYGADGRYVAGHAQHAETGRKVL